MRPMALVFVALFNSIRGLSVLFPIFGPLGRELGLSDFQVVSISAAYAPTSEWLQRGTSEAAAIQRLDAEGRASGAPIRVGGGRGGSGVTSLPRLCAGVVGRLWALLLFFCLLP